MDIYKRIGMVCGKIPEGKVATYGQIALLCGKPKNSRQVGFALNRGLSGEKTNAHRVVNRRGILSGAANFETFDMQRLLLEQEGIQVTWTPKGWQVELKRFGWKSTMEDAVMFRKLFEKEGI
ncbi:MAG: MGMT family protein [Lachnospiraceae bacterium]|nr:MGMT family protein [Lachnospiraceae bacterium]